MDKLVTVRLFDSVVGNDFAYGKGINQMPEHHAAELVRAGHGEYVQTEQRPQAETPESRAAKPIKRRTE